MTLPPRICDLPCIVVSPDEIWAERGEAFIERFRPTGIRWKRFRGFMGLKLGLKAASRYLIDHPGAHDCPHCGRNMAYEIGPGVIGCSLSWQSAVRAAALLELPSVLFVEDDTVPLPDLQERWTDMLHYLPPQWQLINLGGDGHESGTAHRWNERIIEGSVNQNEAIIMNTEAMDAYIQDQQGWAPCDCYWVNYTNQRLNCFYPRPELFTQLSTKGGCRSTL